MSSFLLHTSRQGQDDKDLFREKGQKHTESLPMTNYKIDAESPPTKALRY